MGKAIPRCPHFSPIAFVRRYCPLPAHQDGKMRVKVRLFTTLAHYVPSVKPGEPFEVDLRNGATLSDLLSQLKLPQEEAKVTFVNGRSQLLDFQLENNDEVGIFSAIGGG
jgi:sulfur carrier protein ThiS